MYALGLISKKVYNHEIGFASWSIADIPASTEIILALIRELSKGNKTANQYPQKIEHD